MKPEKDKIKAPEMALNGPEDLGEKDLPENTFLSLDDGDLDFTEADEKIAVIESYEYYLSESFPVCIKLMEAVTEFPILEPILRQLIEKLDLSMNGGWTKQQIAEHAVFILEGELEKK